jgi:small subunit ribosomal protein S1
MESGFNSGDKKAAPQHVGGVDRGELDTEVAQTMSGMSIEDLMAQAVSRPGTPSGPTLDPSRPLRGGRPSRQSQEGGDHGERIHPDNIKRGRIVALREGNAFVDIGGKSQGIVPLEQFDVAGENEEMRAIEIGQEYEFVYKGYDKREGLVVLARRGAITHGAWETLKEGDIVEATVTGVNKGGLELKVNNARAFMPAGQVDTKFHSDISVFLNERMKCQVTKVDREDRNIILSRRVLLEEEEAKAAVKTWEELAVGQIREGTVRSIMPYGAFVDLGGVDGLLHVSAMSHTRVSDPKKIVKEGDKVQVMVVGVDKEKKKVSLGLKQLSKDPWETAAAEFSAGMTITGTVKKIMDFGAFVELKPGVEGLVHISQVSTRRIGKVSEVLKEGQTVQAKVQNVDLDKKRISLSIADVERDARVLAAAEAPAAQAAVAEPAAGEAAVSSAKAGEPAKGAIKAPPKAVRKAPLKGGLG